MNMPKERISDSSSTERLPIATALGRAQASVAMPRRPSTIGIHDFADYIGSGPDRAGCGNNAKALLPLIHLITNLSFFGRFSMAFTSPAGNHLGLWVLVISIIGGVIVG